MTMRKNYTNPALDIEVSELVGTWGLSTSMQGILAKVQRDIESETKGENDAQYLITLNEAYAIVARAYDQLNGLVL